MTPRQSKKVRKVRWWYAVERTDADHEGVVAFNERGKAEWYKRVCKDVPWARTSKIFKVREVLPTKRKKK